MKKRRVEVRHTKNIRNQVLTSFSTTVTKSLVIRQRDLSTLESDRFTSCMFKYLMAGIGFSLRRNSNIFK